MVPECQNVSFAFEKKKKTCMKEENWLTSLTRQWLWVHWSRFSFCFAFEVFLYMSPSLSSSLSLTNSLCVQFSFLCNFNYFLLSPWGVSVKLTTSSPGTSRKVGPWLTNWLLPLNQGNIAIHLPMLHGIIYANPRKNKEVCDRESKNDEIWEIWDWEEAERSSNLHTHLKWKRRETRSTGQTLMISLC